MLKSVVSSRWLCFRLRTVGKAGKYSWCFLHEKSDKAIGYTAKRTFRAGVRDAIAYYIKQNLIHVSERQADKA